MSFGGEAEFYGEVPPPERIGDGNVGISPYNSKADHQHPLILDDFDLVTLTAPWANIGFGFRPVQILKLGNVVYLRGSTNGGGAGTSVISSLDATYWPSNNEVLSIQPAGRIEMLSTGDLRVVGFTATGTPLGLNLMWVVG